MGKTGYIMLNYIEAKKLIQKKNFNWKRINVNAYLNPTNNSEDFQRNENTMALW